MHDVLAAPDTAERYMKKSYVYRYVHMCAKNYISYMQATGTSNALE